MINTLHILGNTRHLDTYPSVYNAIYLLNTNGFKCDVAFSCPTDGFDSYINRRLEYGGSLIEKTNCLGKIKEEYDFIFIYEPLDLSIFELALKKPQHKTLILHSLEVYDLPKTFLFRILFFCLLRTTFSLGSETINKICLYLLRNKLFNKINLIQQMIIFALYIYGFGKVNYLIIQDHLRLNLQLKYKRNKSNIEHALVPNSYIERLEKGYKSLPWIDDLKRDKNKTIVTYIGGIEDWAITEELFDKLSKCKDIIFIFSGWSRFGYAEYLEKYIKDYSYTNIILSVTKKTREELNYLIQESDIGLVFYCSNYDNVYNVGLSSGKFHRFLSKGKPVIVNDLPFLADFTERNGFGVRFSLNELGIINAVEKIINNYAYYLDNIRDNYHTLCSFEDNYKKVMLFLKNNKKG